MHPDESQQLRRAILGDADALAALLEHHGPGVMSGLSIASKWQSIVTPEDVMQVTYLEAFIRITDFVPCAPSAFRAWLDRIAENNLRDAIKELSRAKRPQPDNRITSPNDQSYVDLLQGIAGPGATPSGQVAVKEAISHVEAALATMPEDYERVLRLHELRGHSIRETADQIGRSEGAVKMLLARARDRLRESLGSASRFFSNGA